MIINLHSMQPNGRPHALVRHPVSSIVPKAASENQEKRILQITEVKFNETWYGRWLIYL